MNQTSKDHTAETKAGPVVQITSDSKACQGKTLPVEDAALVAMAAGCRGAKGDIWRSTVRDMCLTPAEGLVGAAIQVEILAHILGWDDCEAWDE